MVTREAMLTGISIELFYHFAVWILSLDCSVINFDISLVFLFFVLQVNLLEPQIDLKHLEKNKDVTLNKKNNIEWNVDLPEKGTKELILKYVIEHPSQMNLQTAENFGNA